MMDGTAIILEQLRNVHERLEKIDQAGSERGRRLWEKLNEQDRELVLLGHRFSKLEESVNGQASTLEQYQDLKKRAEGAGWLGQKLIWIGAFVLSAAGWIYSSWNTIASALKWLAGK
ncbi:hypothetical protein [Rhizobium sp. CAU 1783]